VRLSGAGCFGKNGSLDSLSAQSPSFVLWSVLRCQVAWAARFAPPMDACLLPLRRLLRRTSDHSSRCKLLDVARTFDRFLEEKTDVPL